jgi:hypothetical protein
VQPICQLGEDVSMPAGALRYQDVGSVESVEEVDQLQTLAVGMQRCTPTREDYFGSVGLEDVSALPIIWRPHRRLFGDGFIAS